MVLTLLYLFTLSSLSHSDESVRTNQNAAEDSQEKTGYYLYNELTEAFGRIPKTEDSVDSLLTIGFDNRDKDSGLSFQSARQARTIAEEIDYKEGLARAFNLLGSKYLDFGDHELAHTFYLNAMRIEEDLGNPGGIASALNNISLIYVEQENYETAANYLEESIHTWKSINDKHKSLISTNNLGVIHRRQGNYVKALDYFWDTSKRALLQEEPDSLSYIVATLNIGNTYRNMGKLNRAKIHLHTALEYLEHKELTSHIIFTNIVLGKLYSELSDPDNALMYAKAGLQLAGRERMREKIKEAHELMAEIYEGLHNYALAYKHFQLFHQISDSLLSMQRSEKISELQTRFDIEQKDREIEILNKEAELKEANLLKMSQLRSFLIAGVVILFIVSSLLFSSNRTRRRNNKNLEEKQKQIEDKNRMLSTLNEEKDEFMSIAAHDLRNPLSSINLAVDMINSDETIGPSTIKEYTELIKISSNRMITLINDVLKIHTTTASESKNSKAIVEINPLIDESLQHFNEPARSKNIRINTVFSHKLPQAIGDPDNILRILDNLISNAIKYSPKNTTVIISTRQSEGSVRITVRDQGPGISLKDQKKLFGKFSKLNNKPTGNESSTGLGLYIVKKICSTLNGSVRCESEPGCGATFIVDLPSASDNSISQKKPSQHNKYAVG